MSKPAAQAAAAAEVRVEIQRDAARFALSTYTACVASAGRLRVAVIRLVQNPTSAALRAARAAWIAAREDYGTSEVLRFSGGPIDDRVRGVETYLNAWPIDESYIDGVVDRPKSGIVHDVELFPHLNETGLQVANERGGEENVSIGWHAIEFLLWGQDVSAAGPGTRPVADFDPSVGGVVATRRGRYLLLAVDLLVRHLEQVRDAWSEGDPQNYRTEFLALPADKAIRRVLAGMVVLAGFEMSGERLAVAYESRDQEDEHSCFSDNTHRDFIRNHDGILGLYRGTGRGMRGAGLQKLARLVDAAAADEIDRLMELATRRIAAMPVPFDSLLRAPDGSAERAKMLAAIESLELEAEALAALGLELGFEVPMVPGP